MTQEKEVVVVERKGGKFELWGTLTILLSTGGCSGLMVAGVDGLGMMAGVAGVFAGLMLFVYGRFF